MTMRSRNRCLTALAFLFGLSLTSLSFAQSKSGWTGAHWIQEGNRLLNKGDAAEALEAYDQAASLMPNSAEAEYNRGVALYHLGRFSESETALQNALRPDAVDLESAVKYNLGRCAHAAALNQSQNPEQMLESLKRATEFYKDALLVAPDDADAKRNLAQAEQQVKFIEKLIEQQKQQEQQQDQQQGDGEKKDQEKKDPQQSDQQQQNQNQQGEGQQSEGQSQSQSENRDSKGERGDDSTQSEQSRENQDSSESPDQKTQDGGEPNVEDLEKELEARKNQNGEQKEQQGEKQQAQARPQPEKDGKQDEKEKSKSAEQMSQQEMQAAQESETGEESGEEQQSMKMQDSKATSQPGESAEERMKRISMDHALRLLQEARDKEAIRRQLQQKAKMNRRNRGRVDKDW